MQSLNEFCVTGSLKVSILFLNHDSRKTIGLPFNLCGHFYFNIWYIYDRFIKFPEHILLKYCLHLWPPKTSPHYIMHLNMATLSTVTSMSNVNMFKLVTMSTAQIRVRPAVSATNQGRQAAASSHLTAWILVLVYLTLTWSEGPRNILTIFSTTHE